MINVEIKKQLTKFFIYITVLPGSGKLSTAIVLSSMINAVIVSGLEYNQTSKEARDRIYNTTHVMFQAIEAYPIDSKNYIFVDELIKNNDYNIRIYNSVVELSKKMSTKILPIVLRWSGKEAVLLLPPPLETQHAGFPTLRLSPLSKFFFSRTGLSFMIPQETSFLMVTPTVENLLLRKSLLTFLFVSLSHQNTFSILSQGDLHPL